MQHGTDRAEWVDEQKLLNVGLSTDTIAKLAQEDTRFRRIEGDKVQYDMERLRNHSAIRAAGDRMRGVHGFSYENILKQHFAQ